MKNFGLEDPKTKEEISNIDTEIKQILSGEKTSITNEKTQENAVQKPSTTEVLPRQQGETTEAGGKREGVGPSVKGQEVTQEGGKEEITVFRGKGNNVMNSENDSTLWVAEDKEVAKNYAGVKEDGSFDVEETKISKPQNSIELPYKLATDVKASNIGDNLRLLLKNLKKEGKVSDENVTKILNLISEFENKAGENLELFTTKINKPESREAFSQVVQALGYDSIVQKESATTNGKKTNTYGVFKTQYPSLVNVKQDGGKEEVIATPKEAKEQEAMQNDIDQVQQSTGTVINLNQDGTLTINAPQRGGQSKKEAAIENAKQELAKLGYNVESRVTKPQAKEGGAKKVKVFRTEGTGMGELSVAYRGSGKYFALDTPFSTGKKGETVTEQEIEIDPAKTIDLTKSQETGVADEASNLYKEIQDEAKERYDAIPENERSMNTFNDLKRDIALERGYTGVISYIEPGASPDEMKKIGREYVAYDSKSLENKQGKEGESTSKFQLNLNNSLSEEERSEVESLFEESSNDPENTPSEVFNIDEDLSNNIPFSEIKIDTNDGREESTLMSKMRIPLNFIFGKRVGLGMSDTLTTGEREVDVMDSKTGKIKKEKIREEGGIGYPFKTLLDLLNGKSKPNQKHFGWAAVGKGPATAMVNAAKKASKITGKELKELYIKNLGLDKNQISILNKTISDNEEFGLVTIYKMGADGIRSNEAFTREAFRMIETMLSEEEKQKFFELAEERLNNLVWEDKEKYLSLISSAKNFIELENILHGKDSKLSLNVKASIMKNIFLSTESTKSKENVNPIGSLLKEKGITMESVARNIEEPIMSGIPKGSPVILVAIKTNVNTDTQIVEDVKRERHNNYPSGVS